MRAFFVLIVLGLVVWGLISLASIDPALQAAAGGPIPQTALLPQRIETPRPAAGPLGRFATAEAAARSTAGAAETQARQAEANAAAYQAAQLAEVARITEAAAHQAILMTDEASARQATHAWALVSLTATADARQATANAEASATVAVPTQTMAAIELANAERAARHLDTTLTLDEQRARLTNTIIAYGPFATWALVAILIVCLAGVVMVRLWKSPIEVRRNKAGELPLLAGKNGEIYDPSTSPESLVQFGQDPRPVPLASDEVNERTTARAIAAWAWAHTPPGAQLRANDRPQFAPAQSPQVSGPAYRIYGQDEVPAAISKNPGIMPILDGEWREDK